LKKNILKMEFYCSSVQFVLLKQRNNEEQSNAAFTLNGFDYQE